MVDDYLRTFEDMFFDVEKYEPVKLATDQAGVVLSSIMARYGGIEDETSCGASRQDDFIDAVIRLSVRKIMEQLDAINVLYSAGLFIRAQAILRSLTGNITSMKFILKEDTKKRAMVYLLRHHYQEIGLRDEWFSDDSVYRRPSPENGREEQSNDGYKGYKKKKGAFERITKSREISQQVDRDRKVKLEQKKKKTRGKKARIQ